MAEHTKDKWWYQEDLLQKSIFNDSRKELNLPPAKYKHLSVYGTYPGGTFVAYCGCHKETEANARLIAAAPDLLAILKEAVACTVGFRAKSLSIPPKNWSKIRDEWDKTITKIENLGD